MGFVLAKLVSPIHRWFPTLQQSNPGGSNKADNSRAYFFERLAMLETGEQDDHKAALALERGESLPPPTQAQLKMCDLSFAELLEKFLAADMAVERSRPEAEVSPKITYRMKRKQLSVECVVCRDTFECAACLEGPCGHFFCRECVIAMAEVANNNVGLFPLRCCQQQLPMDVFLSFLPGPLRTTFSFKCAEAATPSGARVYCPNEECSVFISRSPASTPCTVTCAECRTDVCSGCKNRVHPGESCSDSSGRGVRLLARKYGWKTCPSCKMMVERASGCKRILCRCREVFCYSCGEAWENCRCFIPVE